MEFSALTAAISAAALLPSPSFHDARPSLTSSPVVHELAAKRPPTRDTIFSVCLPSAAVTAASALSATLFRPPLRTPPSSSSLTQRGGGAGGDDNDGNGTFVHLAPPVTFDRAWLSCRREGGVAAETQPVGRGWEKWRRGR